MDFALMEQVAQGLQRVKPSRYVFAYAITFPFLLNCYAGHLPRQHIMVGEGYVKLSVESLRLFKDCFPNGGAPEIIIK